MYQLDKQLKQDTIFIGKSTLCDVLLMNDQRYPWVILVPRQADVREVYQLTEADQLQLNHESCFVAQAMARLFMAKKMNVAALGNVVSQLHIHHIARFDSDAVWPRPVWGVGTAKRYSDVAANAMLSQLRRAFADILS